MEPPKSREALLKAVSNLLAESPNLNEDQFIARFQLLELDNTLNIPQIKQLLGQVKNSAGGFSYKLSDWKQLKRFVILGTETGTYYSKPQDLLEQNCRSLEALIENDEGLKVLDLIEKYSREGRCPKDDTLLFVLAVLATYFPPDGVADEEEKEKYEKLRQEAYKKVLQMCNISTKLFCFVNLCQKRIANLTKKNETGETNCVEESPNSSKRKHNETAELEDPKTPPKRPKLTEETKKKKKKKKKKPSGIKKSLGWGRMRRRGIGQFYTDLRKDANSLLYQLTKYKNRHDWNHKQVLGYSHPKVSKSDPQKTAKDLVLTYTTRGFDRFRKMADSLRNPDSKVKDIINNINVIEAISKLSPIKDEERLLIIFEQYGTRKYEENDGSKPFMLVREHIPNGFFRSAKLWELMLEEMPMMAMIRNLGTMTGLGLFEKEEHVSKVVNKLNNTEILKKAKIHPMKILIAMLTYEKGEGKGKARAEQQRSIKGKDGEMEVEDNSAKGPITWIANKRIKEALNDAFYKSFKQPDIAQSYKTGKKFMLALDVSGSMNYQGCVGCEDITPAMASCALALMTWHVEDNCEIMAFGGHLQNIKGPILQKEMTVPEAVLATGRLNFGATDCALPMEHALESGMHDIDVFIVYTDSETYAGRVHPSKALQKYRKQTPKKDAKLIVMGMQSNGFSIADPEDPGMLDVVGFDSAVPEIINQFVKGEMEVDE